MHLLRFLAALAPVIALAVSCSATNDADPAAGGGSVTGTGGNGTGGSTATCNICDGVTYKPCSGDPETCPIACANDKGCVACVPDQPTCVGNEVHSCNPDGSVGGLLETCDTDNGKVCSNGVCAGACEVSAAQPSNVGCEFWAVDLDQQDGFNDPASAPWGVALSNAGQGKAHVTIEINGAPVGQNPAPELVQEVDVDAGSLVALVLPTRELDCGVVPNDYASPGTCLSSNAYRIKSTAPIVVYQFNVFENAYSNDASLLLPTNALGQIYRVIGWGAGHPVKIGGFNILDRSYVTVVGVTANTKVKVKPSWRIKGNPPVAATPAGGTIEVTIGPFDVLNLETDDGTFQDDPKTIADLSGTLVEASAPVAVFSGVESTGAPGVFDVPKPPGWMDGDSCCLDHLEDQMFPVESIGTNYVITRSPVRSTSSFREPDILRFVGAAETTQLTTTLPPPFDSFTLQPGEVQTTWTQDDVIVKATKPVMVGQILVSNQYVDGPYIGDPSLTVYPPIEQFRDHYVILTPGSWDQNWVVVAAEQGSKVDLDGQTTTGCTTESSGVLEGKTFESRRCPLAEGVHTIVGDKPFGIVAYGYGNAGSYAFVGGADVEKIYEPPPIN